MGSGLLKPNSVRTCVVCSTRLSGFVPSSGVETSDWDSHKLWSGLLMWYHSGRAHMLGAAGNYLFQRVRVAHG